MIRKRINIKIIYFEVVMFLLLLNLKDIFLCFFWGSVVRVGKRVKCE